MGLIFENLYTDFMLLLGILLFTLYSYLSHIYGYWERRNVKFIKPTFLAGNVGPTLLQKLSIAELFQQLYNSTSERFIGFWVITKPMLMIRDPELVRSILIKDYQYFKDRGVYCDEKNDPLSGHIFSLAGDKWKNFRAKLTPVFTSGKLKAMFSTVLDCAQTLEDEIGKFAANKEEFEVREVSARFTTNIIASVAFGNEIDCFKDPETPFRHYGRKAFELTFVNGIRSLGFLTFPKLLSLFRLKGVDDDVEKFIFSVVNQTLEYRERNNVSRKDLFQLLLQLKNEGAVQEDGVWESSNKDVTKSGMTLNEMAAQVWVFFIAGFETSSTTLSFCLYELSKNPEIQRKIQAEIDEVSGRCNGKFTYEALGELKYLERCIDETLRKYPALPILNRECNTAYKLPGTNTIIEPGTAIMIPNYALQMDPKYYPNPDVFDPDRFLDNSKSFVEQPYLAFGEGPRNCIGLRLAKIQTKVGLLMMLRKYSYKLAANMKGPLVFSPKLNIMTPIGGINVNVERRDD